MNSADGLRELIARHGIRESSDEARRLFAYLALLEKWNAGINLTASTAWSSLVGFFEEAMWASRLYPQARITHMDIGSGAGFPAVPMRILRPAMRLRLVESRAKRAVFLETVTKELGLDNTEVICRRAEEYLRSRPLPEFDIASWKGLKLSTVALGRLLAASKPETRLWLFHGPKLPLENPAAALKSLRLVQREHFPGRPSWQLSIYEFLAGCFT
jgi:16S rRNA (guanine(527)-N(7))-methyltransferase RsmG